MRRCTPPQVGMIWSNVVIRIAREMICATCLTGRTSYPAAGVSSRDDCGRRHPALVRIFRRAVSCHPTSHLGPPSTRDEAWSLARSRRNGNSRKVFVTTTATRPERSKVAWRPATIASPPHFPPHPHTSAQPPAHTPTLPAAVSKDGFCASAGPGGGCPAIVCFCCRPLPDQA